MAFPVRNRSSECYNPLFSGHSLLPVCSSRQWKNQTGDRFSELAEKLSLANQVVADTSPAFLWHTIEDQAVHWQNSLLFAQAMIRQNRPCELHLFPSGQHGMQLGYGRKDIGLWPQMARNFLSSTCSFSLDGAILF